MNWPPPFAPLLASCLLLAVTACGGGSSGGNDSPPPDPPAPPPPAEPRYSLSGTVTLSANLVADSDNNDPVHSLLPNDTPATAQAIANPVTLGGYVRQPGAGEPGPSFDSGDVEDFFVIDLFAGQAVDMLVADYQQADADLYLLDENGAIVDFSIETGEFESISVRQDGRYLINVSAFHGATNYILAIGNNPLGAGTRNLAKPDIVPWEAVVSYREALPEATAREQLSRRMGMRVRAGGGRRPRLMAMAQHEASREQRRARLGYANSKTQLMANTALRERWETLLTIKRLNQNAQVKHAEPNYRLSAQATPNDDAYPLQWHYPMINLPGAWDLSTGDPSVLVAVVDTGILGAHPDFSGQLQGGYDFVADPELSGDGDGIDPDPEDPGDSSSPGGGSFHGSHVGGTIAAATDNRIGVSGVAWRARLMPLRALGGSGEGRSYDVNQAIRYAAGLDNDSGEKPPQRADIINLSLGGGGFSPTTAALFDEVRAAGVIVVAAAGNEGSSSPSYPAAYDGVISVGAVNSQQQLAGYSNFGSTVDAVAPGGDNGIDLNGDGYPDGVLSVGATVDDNGFRFAYPFLAGTSMATPHVAGVLALMKSVNADLTPADIDALLLQGALTNDLGSPGRDDRYGHGLINALAAVTAALTAAGTPPAENPFVTSSTRSLNFSSRAEQLQFSLQNGGSGPLRVIDIATTKPWLSVSPQEVDSQGLGRYRVTVERGDLSPGVYGGRVIVDTDVNALSMDVLMSVADDNGSGDVGVVYLLLTNLDDPDQVRQVVLRTQLGELDYHFDDLPGGRYDIFAGTDADNDSLICDAGEACGAYLTTDSPIELVLDGDVEDLDFPMEYLVSFLAQFSQSTQATETLTPRRRPVD